MFQVRKAPRSLAAGACGTGPERTIAMEKPGSGSTDNLFDSIARLLGRGMPRRDALRLIGTTLAAGLFGTAAGKASAADPCDDPSNHCERCASGISCPTDFPTRGGVTGSHCCCSHASGCICCVGGTVCCSSIDDMGNHTAVCCDTLDNVMCDQRAYSCTRACASDQVKCGDYCIDQYHHCCDDGKTVCDPDKQCCITASGASYKCVSASWDCCGDGRYCDPLPDGTPRTCCKDASGITRDCAGTNDACCSDGSVYRPNPDGTRTKCCKGKHGNSYCIPADGDCCSDGKFCGSKTKCCYDSDGVSKNCVPVGGSCCTDGIGCNKDYQCCYDEDGESNCIGASDTCCQDGEGCANFPLLQQCCYDTRPDLPTTGKSYCKPVTKVCCDDGTDCPKNTTGDYTCCKPTDMTKCCPPGTTCCPKGNRPTSSTAQACCPPEKECCQGKCCDPNTQYCNGQGVCLKKP